MDLTKNAEELLHLLANSIYDREQPPAAPFSFTTNEIKIVEKYLQELTDKTSFDAISACCQLPPLPEQ